MNTSISRKILACSVTGNMRSIIVFIPVMEFVHSTSYSWHLTFSQQVCLVVTIQAEISAVYYSNTGNLKNSRQLYEKRIQS